MVVASPIFSPAREDQGSNGGPSSRHARAAAGRGRHPQAARDMAISPISTACCCLARTTPISLRRHDLHPNTGELSALWASASTLLKLSWREGYGPGLDSSPEGTGISSRGRADRDSAAGPSGSSRARTARKSLPVRIEHRELVGLQAGQLAQCGAAEHPGKIGWDQLEQKA